MSQTTDLSSKSTLCIICLEELNDDIMEACDTCNINCHIECLYSWYIKNNVELCPICLKHTDNNTSITNELFQLNNTIINNNNNNNNNNNDRRETVEIDVENIREIFDNERDTKLSCILFGCIFILIITAVIFLTS